MALDVRLLPPRMVVKLDQQPSVRSGGDQIAAGRCSKRVVANKSPSLLYKCGSFLILPCLHTALLFYCHVSKAETVNGEFRGKIFLLCGDGVIVGK